MNDLAAVVRGAAQRVRNGEAFNAIEATLDARAWLSPGQVDALAFNALAAMIQAELDGIDPTGCAHCQAKGE